MKELLLLSNNVEEYAADIIRQEAPQPGADKKKGSPLIAISAVVALIAIVIAAYFFFLK